MKTISKLILGAAVAASSLTFAQKFGAKANLNLSSISGTSSAANTSTKVGFSVGGFAKFEIDDKISIQPELMYNQMGSKSVLVDAGTPLIGEISTSTNLDYISVPIMLQYKLAEKFYAEVGPEFSLLLNARQALNTGIINPSITIDKNYLNTFNIGAGIGVGYSLNENIGINARYTFGLNGIGKKGSVTEYFLNDAKNNNLQIGASFTF